MDFFELAKARYSCKKFSEKAVEEDKLTKVLEGGRLAPTAKNSQPQHIYVLRSEESLKIVDTLTPCRYGAPVVLAVAHNKQSVFEYPGGVYNSGAEDAAIVATHLVLAAKEVGLDTCWLNFFDPDKAKAELGLPDNEMVTILLDLGYPDATAKPLPNHESRKPLSETVTYR
ncbi:MAG: nitroreductase family protein [Schwartzia sp.]|nr:nitroreductase family protein [Schwartzia sp. (in: firmicutes)]